MHSLEPFFRWRDEYTAEEDERSPFFERTYDELYFSNAIYNYYIHPQWDDFGSSTLYLKILFTDYNKGFTIIELIGEWNDALHNDIMYFKRNVVEHLMSEGVRKFILISDNVLNYHGDDDSYYEEWLDEIKEYDGWIININLLEHVKEEMQRYSLDYYIDLPDAFNDLEWRVMKPNHLFKIIDEYFIDKIKRIQ